jgi:hypothetical protein
MLCARNTSTTFPNATNNFPRPSPTTTFKVLHNDQNKCMWQSWHHIKGSIKAKVTSDQTPLCIRSLAHLHYTEMRCNIRVRWSTNAAK